MSILLEDGGQTAYLYHCAAGRGLIGYIPGMAYLPSVIRVNRCGKEAEFFVQTEEAEHEYELFTYNEEVKECEVEWIEDDPFMCGEGCTADCPLKDAA